MWLSDRKGQAIGQGEKATNQPKLAKPGHLRFNGRLNLIFLHFKQAFGNNILFVIMLSRGFYNDE